MESLALHIERAGSGPNVVLAHGFGGSARNFRPQQRAFAAEYTVIAYDARGHARSAAPLDPEAYTEAALVADFARVVGGAGGPAVVGGLSLGAYTALVYALGARDQVAGLVLASFPGAASTPKGARWANAFADAIEQQGLERAGAEFVWGEASRFDPKAAALIRQGLLEHPPHALVALLRQVLARFRAPDGFAAELGAFPAPVLIVAGSDDTPARDASERLAALLPRAELVIVPNGGHVVNLASPEPFNQALRDFLRRALVKG